jgi:hypothetical protein
MNLCPRLPGFVLVALVVTAARAIPAEPPAAEFFEKEVRPLLVERCQNCHGDQKQKGGLNLTSRVAILRGGERGPAAVPGKPEESLLVKAVRQAGDLKMPPKGQLTDREVATLTRWVADGLPWPEAKVTAAPALTDEQRRFWSFQPVRDPAPPAVKDAAWAKSPLDRFILAGLAAKGLKPAAPADKRTLIRRATFDLTGLPPTPEEINAFLGDESPDAFAKAVDRLLSSPAYGERWGRHWLDLARYTDSFDARLGPGDTMDATEAWRYRDWVVNAFNRDLPYDQFVRDQVAGDVLPGRGVDGVVATGLLAIGNWGGGDADKEKLLTDVADDQLDVVCRTFLGLTVACARCHDHKFDPITTEDYYGLAGIFFSTHILENVGPKTNGPPMLRVPLETAEERSRREQLADRVKELERRIEGTRATAAKALAERLRPDTTKYLQAARDFAARPAERRGETVAQFAGRAGLHAFAVRQWLDRLGLGDDRPFDVPLRDVAGRPGVHGWRGPGDTPNLLVNTTAASQTLGTLTLPPRSLAVHPGPTGGVALAWRAPADATVRVRGRLADADPNCGDGVLWALDRRTSDGRTELAAGRFANGGAQSLTEGEREKALAAVSVRAGDALELVVLPGPTHACDTTLVEWTITTADGAQEWDVVRDWLADPLAGNPHADGLGHPAVWQAADATGRGRPGKENDDPFLVRTAADETALPAADALAKLRAELDALKKSMEPVPFANGAQEGGVPGSPQAGVHDVRVHVRGSYRRLGELVPRHFPTVLAGDRQPPITVGSGRHELAGWLTRPENPLTARVLVNRLWQHHFGEGIVRTPSNFGQLGERPTHPELLDWLASRFVGNGWSMKAMHRVIMLSSTYQQASTPSSDALRLDPDNRLWGRANRRRLEAEELRDELLAASGRLDRTAGGPAVRDFGSPRRTLYLRTNRSDRSGFGSLFDAADPTAHAEKRTVSTVAPQALFLMNHPFVKDQARALAERLLKERADEAGRIERAYELLYARPPAAAAAGVGREFLAGATTAEAWSAYCQILTCANEFVDID